MINFSITLTYVIGSIHPRKSVHSSNEPDEKRQSAGAPITSIIECGEDLFCWLMRSQINQWDQDTKEPQDVKEKH